MPRITNQQHPRRYRSNRNRPGKLSRGRNRQVKQERLKLAKGIKTINKQELDKSLSSIGVMNSKAELKETESFIALANSAMGKIDQGLSDIFSKIVKRRSTKLENRGRSYPLFRAGKRALKALLRRQEINRATAKEIRKLAGGLAQLDENKTDLTGKIKLKEGETVSEVIMEKMLDNEKLSNEEFEALKESNKAMLTEQPNKVEDTAGNSDPLPPYDVTPGIEDDPITDLPMDIEDLEDVEQVKIEVAVPLL